MYKYTNNWCISIGVCFAITVVRVAKPKYCIMFVANVTTIRTKVTYYFTRLCRHRFTVSTHGTNRYNGNQIFNIFFFFFRFCPWWNTNAFPPMIPVGTNRLFLSENVFVIFRKSISNWPYGKRFYKILQNKKTVFHL